VTVDVCLDESVYFVVQFVAYTGMFGPLKYVYTILYAFGHGADIFIFLTKVMISNILVF
jgi:hypothetical protein